MTESTTADTSTAPHCLEPDTYTGRWQVTKAPTNTAYGIGRAFAYDLAATYGAGVPFIIWEFSGHTRGGYRLFTRARYVSDSSGHLHGYDSGGRRIIVHPASREVRYLTTLVVREAEAKAAHTGN